MFPISLQKMCLEYYILKPLPINANFRASANDNPNAEWNGTKLKKETNHKPLSSSQEENAKKPLILMHIISLFYLNMT